MCAHDDDGGGRGHVHDGGDDDGGHVGVSGRAPCAQLLLQPGLPGWQTGKVHLCGIS